MNEQTTLLHVCVCSQRERERGVAQTQNALERWQAGIILNHHIKLQ